MSKCNLGFIAAVVAICFSTTGFAQKLIPKTSVLTSPVNGQIISQKAKKQIKAYSDVRSGSVSLIAGEQIILGQGLHVADGASLNARIEDINDSEDFSWKGAPVREIDESVLNLSTYPNPFENGLQVEYWLPADTQVTVEIVTASGRIMHSIVNKQFQRRGLYKVRLDSKLLPSGTYLCVLKTTNDQFATKIVRK